MHDFGLFELAQKLKLKYVVVSVGTFWVTCSLFGLSLAVNAFCWHCGHQFAVVLD